MSKASQYSPGDIESHWYDKWMNHKIFHSEPDERTPYTIVIPPPNVTGMLHMGHMLNNTIQDVLIRRARMLGFNACWVPGTDHASIATEAKVVGMLAERGIKKADVTREEFLEHAHEWKEKYGGIILKQLRRLGCSCDWDRTRFTMEDDLYKSVIKVFVDLHQKGLIYRGARMVNWDPVGKTALSDEEVIYTEENSRLFYLKYKVVGSDNEFLTVATTRPETILGDTGVCVNPNDERFSHLKGAKVIVPLLNREVPVIFDDYVDMEFGTGALKVTPAHDPNDYELGRKYKLESVDIFEKDATISESAGMYVGMDRFDLRKQIAKDLEEAELLDKTEDYRNKVGRSERTRAIIEPRMSQQWFMNMEQFIGDTPEVLESVMSDEVKFYPPKLKNTYRHWIEGIRDWCISRQLWWGHRIPAYYLPNGEFVVAETEEDALKLAQDKDASIQMSDLKQDEDVLDTWFSSWLWPISVFNGIMEPENEEVNYYYPTNTLVTAPDIIFFWVARMIMAGFEYRGVKPFDQVYFTGIVRDKQRRKMSKQLGNSPDPIDLMDQYGTDGVRMGLLLSAPAGNDLLFDEALCEQGRNFCNKIWNAYRLVDGWEDKGDEDTWFSSNAELANNWMRQRIDRALEQVEESYAQFRISEAMMTLYKLVWNDFCSWYLEMMKPEYGKSLRPQDLKQVKAYFEELMRILHPFMPFITEELWQGLKSEGDFINLMDHPVSTGSPADSSEMDLAMSVISTVRALRNENGISPKTVATIHNCTKAQIELSKYEGLISKLANVSTFDANAASDNTIDKLVGTSELQFSFDGVELGGVDPEKVEAELKRLRGFLIGIEKKLGNEKFVANAKPEIVDRERQKKEDTLSKIDALERELSKASR